MRVWDRILLEVEKRVDPLSFQTWFKPLLYVGTVGNSIYVKVPSASFKALLVENFSDLLQAVVKEIIKRPYEIKFFYEEEEQQRNIKEIKRKYHVNLNPNYTFENFVEAPSNQFAYSAALAVAKAPSKAYNPLFIYGGVGLGKTHLLNAIGHFIMKTRPELVLVYTTTEKFMNEMVAYMRNHRIIDFKEKYRNIDVLLIDDIQFLSGKEYTQVEFFHIFNTLYESQKQIVITSDRPPREIQTLEDRLHSRFEWGLIADIQPPDLETKVAIFKKKAEILREKYLKEGKEFPEIPENVAYYIASKIKSNIRQLEGALIRLIALSSLKREPVTIDLAKEALKTIIDTFDEKLITPETIIEYVAENFGLKPEELKSRTNSRKVTFPRQIAMYLCKRLTNCSLPEIGKAFGGKHHTTVLHSINKIEDLIKKDPSLKKKITEMEEFFK